MSPLIYIALNTAFAGVASWGVAAGLRIGHLLCFALSLLGLIALGILWSKAPEANSSADLVNNAFGQLLVVASLIFTVLGLIGGWRAGKNWP